MSTQNRNFASVLTNKIFEGVDKTQLEPLLDTKSFIHAREGDIIFSTGENPDFLFLITEGIVKVKLSDKNQLFEKKANDFFGETEILKNVARNSSAVAETDCVLYRLDKEKFGQMTKTIKGIIKNVSEEQSDKQNGTDSKKNNFNINENSSPDILSYPTDKIEVEEDEIDIDEKLEKEITSSDKNDVDKEIEEPEPDPIDSVPDIPDTELTEDLKVNYENEMMMPDLIKNLLKNQSAVLNFYREYLNSGKISGTAEHLIQLITEQSEFYSELVLAAVEFFEDKQLLKKTRTPSKQFFDQILELLSEQLAPDGVTLYKKYEVSAELFADKYRMLTVFHLCSRLLLNYAEEIDKIYFVVSETNGKIQIKLFIESMVSEEDIDKLKKSHEFLLSKSIVEGHNGTIKISSDDQNTEFVFILEAENIAAL